MLLAEVPGTQEGVQRDSLAGLANQKLVGIPDGSLLGWCSFGSGVVWLAIPTVRVARAQSHGHERQEAGYQQHYMMKVHDEGGRN